MSPSMRIDGRAPDDRYRTDAPRAAAWRSTRSRLAEFASASGAGTSPRIGLRVSGTTGAGAGAGSSGGAGGSAATLATGVGGGGFTGAAGGTRSGADRRTRSGAVASARSRAGGIILRIDEALTGGGCAGSGESAG